MSSDLKRAHDGDNDDETPLNVDQRFDHPRRLSWRRAVLVALLAVFIWLVFHLRPKSQPNVIYASRYSKEFKFRPAASPVITERLKDGRIRLRGAIPP